MNIPTAPSLRRLSRTATASFVLTCLLAASANAEESGRLRGRLWVTAVEFVEDCSETAFARGDTVMLTGSGLAPGEAVVISFMQNDAENPIGSAKANGQGALSTRLPVPADAATGKDARFRATAERGSEGAGVVLTSGRAADLRTRRRRQRRRQGHVRHVSRTRERRSVRRRRRRPGRRVRQVSERPRERRRCGRCMRRRRHRLRRSSSAPDA